MDISFSNSPLFIILIIALAAGMSWFMYRGTSEILTRRWRIFLGVFRFVALCLMAILLLKPMMVMRSSVEYPPVIAFLQDNSESLLVQKDSSFVKNEYPGLLKDLEGQFNGDNFDFQMFGFGTSLESKVEVDSLSFSKTGTNISQALKDLKKLYQNQNLQAVVLASDGILTSGINPLYGLEGNKVPIYTVLLGDTSDQKDIIIKEVLFNEIAYLNNDMPIRVKIQSNGFDRAPLQVRLRNRDKVLDTQSLNLNSSKNQGEITFLVKPEEVGLQQFRIEVSRLENEISYRNNSRNFFVNVLETRVKIALFAGSPHPDLGALRIALKREKSYELDEFILKQSGTYYLNPNTVNLEDYDLFILHNWPGSSADKAMVDKLSEQIKEQNKPVMYFSGIFTDLRSMQPLFEYMAISPKSYSPRAEEVIPDFKKKYSNHSTFTFADNWLQWANSVPPVYRNNSAWEAKKTAEVYATAKIKNVQLDYPVYALQNHLGRKNMVFLGENFWRMRAHSYTESGDFEQFDAWLFNNIKWLIVSDDKRKFKVSPSKRIFTGSDPILFSGQAYDDSYNPLPKVAIKLSIKSPDGSSTDYFLNETQDAQYFIEIPKLEEGTYSYTAEGRKDNAMIGTDRGQFSVGRSNIEHFQLQADKELMEQISLRTEGEFLFARDLGGLSDKLKALPGMKPQLDTRRSRTPFHNFPWILGILLSLLSVEWVVRKLNSLL